MSVVKEQEIRKPVQSGRLTAEEISKIKELHLAGKTKQEIADIVGRSVQNVSYHIQNCRKEEKTEDSVAETLTKGQMDKVIELCKRGDSKETIARKLHMYLDDVNECVSLYKRSGFGTEKAVSKLKFSSKGVQRVK